ncbi:hypothetical protein BDN72DRAFT_844747 [Pluteus cervinus]|uniref:Uncharacterized protein n=1 Tax=Pluteus cervinus TaxID=181527 RepID=A0ACD3ALJ4_9AGAR|nr:hypothetical protein BDN72DRAFT_844747 [Pluteus cervinus]
MPDDPSSSQVVLDEKSLDAFRQRLNRLYEYECQRTKERSDIPEQVDQSRLSYYRRLPNTQFEYYDYVSTPLCDEVIGSLMTEGQLPVQSSTATIIPVLQAPQPPNNMTSSQSMHNDKPPEKRRVRPSKKVLALGSNANGSKPRRKTAALVRKAPPKPPINLPSAAAGAVDEAIGDSSGVGQLDRQTASSISISSSVPEGIEHEATGATLASHTADVDKTANPDEGNGGRADHPGRVLLQNPQVLTVVRQYQEARVQLEQWFGPDFAKDLQDSAPLTLPDRQTDRVLVDEGVQVARGNSRFASIPDEDVEMGQVYQNVISDYAVSSSGVDLPSILEEDGMEQDEAAPTTNKRPAPKGALSNRSAKSKNYRTPPTKKSKQNEAGEVSKDTNGEPMIAYNEAQDAEEDSFEVQSSIGDEHRHSSNTLDTRSVEPLVDAEKSRPPSPSPANGSPELRTTEPISSGPVSSPSAAYLSAEIASTPAVEPVKAELKQRQRPLDEAKLEAAINASPEEANNLRHKKPKTLSLRGSRLTDKHYAAFYIFEPTLTALFCRACLRKEKFFIVHVDIQPWLALVHIEEDHSDWVDYFLSLSQEQLDEVCCVYSIKPLPPMSGPTSVLVKCLS